MSLYMVEVFQGKPWIVKEQNMDFNQSKLNFNEVSKEMDWMEAAFAILRINIDYSNQ